MSNGVSDQELFAAWQKIVEQLAHLPEVQAFQQAERKIENHERIHQLREQIKLEQKALVNAKHYEKTGAVHQHQANIADLEAELELIPLWHQYQELKNEVNEFIQTVIAEIELTLS